MIVFLTVSTLLGIIIGAILFSYEDGGDFRVYRGLNCKRGKHMFKEGKRKKYFCVVCGEKRAHPNLSVVNGGRSDIRIFKD